ncbi:UDP-glucose 4-epimerase GalE [Candidatus Woesearchaeota archaeon]|nr:MAG: UDP-glucose 4-epimerase GalE [Candidatus Woesearchaeota archaeon]
MKCLVVGGAGYIGSHVTKKLCELGHEVVVFDNLRTGSEENVDSRAKLVEGNILNEEDLEKAFSGKVDCVFHFAALKAAGESMKKPEEYSKNNICGTISLLNAMLKHSVNKIVFSSSAAVYGSPKYLPIDEKHPLKPDNFYGYTKLAIEQVLEWYSKLKGLRYAALRYFNAAGNDSSGVLKVMEKNPANLMPVVMEVASGRREIVEVFGNDYDTNDGTGIRDYIHVDDLADAHVMALDYIVKKGNLVVNLGSEKGYSVLEVIKEAERVVGRKIPFRIVGRRKGDPAKVVASSRLAFELLGWKAKLGLKEMLETMWDVYK